MQRSFPRWLALVCCAVACVACAGADDGAPRDAAVTPSAADASTDTAGAVANMTDAGPPGVVDAAVGAANPAMAPGAMVQPPPPCPAATDPAREASETRCDGIDNDCDGLVDVLLPLEPNRCAAACGVGHYGCSAGARVCLAPGPAAEVLDGVDNDCDGAVDEATPGGRVQPRALLLVPDYLKQEGGADTDNLAAFLELWGIPYDRPAADETFDAQLEHLEGHSLAIVSSYLEGDFFTAWRAEPLRAFAEAGGIVVVFKPVLAPGDPGSMLLGLDGTLGRRDLERMSFDADAMGATRAFDSPEERSVPLRGLSDEETPVSWILQPTADTQVGAYGYIGDARIGALLTRRSVGYGAVYALGHDLHSFWHKRCYVNCFEPSSDLVGLFLREAMRESARGHLVLKHTVPGLEDSLVILSHDVDAPDAQRAGPVWGMPGAEQVALLEQRHGARGSFFITTDYINGYYAPELMKRLCELGVCPAGVHSVRHAADLPGKELGDCMETRASYAEPETLCGEVRVPLQILEEDCGHRPLAFRAPYLYVHPQLYDVLESQGILFDSSYAVGDLKFNLPLSLARISINEFRFHRRALYSMPIALEDGIGDVVEGKETRMEMSAENARRFETLWRYTMLGNAANGAHTMVLLHPSYGLNVPEDNLKNKLAVEESFLSACSARRVKLDATAEDLATFWRAREDSQLDATYEGGTYRGSLKVGQHPLQNLTLEFGDAIQRFECDSCGTRRIEGRRVQLTAALAPGSVHMFSASPGK